MSLVMADRERRHERRSLDDLITCGRWTSRRTAKRGQLVIAMPCKLCGKNINQRGMELAP